MCDIFVKKYNFEKSSHLTTIEKIEQEDDKLVIFRRHDAYQSPITTWEQVVINR